jgi:hypothetical protein
MLRERTHYFGGSTMITTVIAAFIIWLSCSAYAADPIIGAWKLDKAKSRLSNSPTTPKELTDTYVETAQGIIELTRNGIQNDGAAISSKWSWPKQGGVAHRILPDPLPKDTSFVAVLVAPGKWYVSIMNAGKQISFYGKDTSKDGKVLHITLKGTDEKGNPFDELFVFKRQ